MPEKNIEISISKSITITYFYKTLKQRLDFKICGSISERINDIKFLDNYIKDYCAYGCKWFLIKKVK